LVQVTPLLLPLQSLKLEPDEPLLEPLPLEAVTPLVPLEVPPLVEEPLVVPVVSLEQATPTVIAEAMNAPARR
jgi:hypothetical protein